MVAAKRYELTEAQWARIAPLLPGMEKIYRYNDGVHVLRHAHDGEQIAQLFSLQDTLQGLANPQLWIGAVIGAAMIFAAIRLRRWRDEG